MAKAIVTLKIMPESPDIDLDKVASEAEKMIIAYAGDGDRKKEIEPIAFGLKALKMIFVMDEAKGSPEPLENDIKRIKGVQSVEVIDVRRAIG
ncbi:elongation factor 1-beta [Candidatus Woesearchaeota archaeon]|nr:elongation factor 1-beta [Candidatus Woesearchaeota archaeon]